MRIIGRAKKNSRFLALGRNHLKAPCTELSVAPPPGSLDTLAKGLPLLRIGGTSVQWLLYAPAADGTPSSAASSASRWLMHYRLSLPADLQ